MGLLDRIVQLQKKDVFADDISTWWGSMHAKRLQFSNKRAEMVYKILVRLFFFSAVLVTLWDFVIIQEMNVHLSFVNVIGLCLFFVGVCMRVAAIRTLKEYFLTDLRTLQGHRLIKHGVYKYVRHPAYLGTFLLSIGISLIFSSFYGFLLMLGVLFSYLYRINNEERMLLKEFGDEYRDYKRRTKKIIPFIY